MKRFEDQRKRTLDDCKYRAENPQPTTPTRSATTTKSTTTTTKGAKSGNKQK
jgi:hypothetical protein